MALRPSLALIAGGILVSATGFGAGVRYGPQFVSTKQNLAHTAIAEAGGTGVSADFINRFGWPTRHPLLKGGGKLPEDTRANVAQAVSDIPGVGGVFWADGTITAEAGERIFTPLHCQDDVEGLLRTRTIRFEESSAALAPASRILLDEVTKALRPCLGAIIAITGHTDSSGTEPGNLALSLERARTVREALVRRGIPRDGLRVRGLGSQQPVKGLAPSDPANRRIEFSVIATQPMTPTPVDTPGAR